MATTQQKQRLLRGQPVLHSLMLHEMVVPHSSSLTAAASGEGPSSKPLSPSNSERAPTANTTTMMGGNGGKGKSSQMTGGVVSSSDTESLSAAAINRKTKKFDSFSSSLDYEGKQQKQKGRKSSFGKEQYHPAHQTVANGAGGKGINSSSKQEVTSSRMWNESFQSGIDAGGDFSATAAGSGGDSVCCIGLSPSVGGGGREGIGEQAWIKDHKITQERSGTGEDPFALYRREEEGDEGEGLSPELPCNSSPSSSTTGPTIVATCRGIRSPSDPEWNGSHSQYTDRIKHKTQSEGYQQESRQQLLTSMNPPSFSTPAVSGSSSSSHMYQRSEKEDHVVRNCSRLSSDRSVASVSTTPSPCPGCPPGYHESFLSSVHQSSSSNPHLSEIDVGHQSYFGGGSGRIIGVDRLGGGGGGIGINDEATQEVDLPLEPSDLLKALPPPASPSSSPDLVTAVGAVGIEEGEHEGDEIGRHFSSGASRLKKQLQSQEPFPLLHHVQQPHRNLVQRSLPATLFRPHSSSVVHPQQPGSSSFRSSSSTSCQTQTLAQPSSGQQHQQTQGFLERRSNEANRRRRLQQNVMISRQAAQYEDDGDEDDSIPPPPPPPSVSPSRLRPIPCYPNRTPRSKPRK